MLLYPQLASGALSQFPVQKRCSLRTVTNVAPDSRETKLSDPAAGFTEWSLSYSGLSDQELAALQDFFLEAEGSLNQFTFLDPTDNLLAWSEQLDNAVWEVAPLLSVSGGIADLWGGNKGWHLSNSGAAAQRIVQTLPAPGGYLYCFSVYIRSLQGSAVTMLLGEHRADRVVTGEWKRIVLASAGDPGQDSVAFGLEVPAGGSVDVYGMQVEPQGAPSQYRKTTKGGVYPGARLRDDSLGTTTTGVDSHSCTVNIFHANHL